MNYIARAERKPLDKLEADSCEFTSYANFVDTNLCDFSIRLFGEAGFQVSAQSRSVENFTLARFTTREGKAELRRGQSELSDGEDRYAVSVPVSGELEAHQFQRRERCAPGSATLVSCSDRCTYQKLGDNDTIYLYMPASFVKQRFIYVEDHCGRQFPAPNGIRHLALETLASLQRDAFAMSADEFRSAVEIVGELLLVALCGSGEIASKSVRANNLARVKRVIRKRYSEAELTLIDIAEECGLSLRYVHDLFKDEGHTASDYLRAERLQRARQMLESATPTQITVTDVCMAAGFNNPSHFSTAFRTAFSVSPRDILYRSRQSA